MGGVISFVSLVVAVEYVFEKSFIEKQFLTCTNELISALLVWVSQIIYDETRKMRFLYRLLSVVVILTGLVLFGIVLYIYRFHNYRRMRVYILFPIVPILIQASTGLLMNTSGVGFAAYMGLFLLCRLLYNSAPAAMHSSSKSSLSMVSLVFGVVSTSLVYYDMSKSDDLIYYFGIPILVGLVWLFYFKTLENMGVRLNKSNPILAVIFSVVVFPFFVMFFIALSGGVVLVLLLLYLMWYLISEFLRYFWAPSFFHYFVNIVFGTVALLLLSVSSRNIWKIFCGDHGLQVRGSRGTM